MQEKKAETVGDRIKATRRKAGITLLGVSKLVGYAATTISGIENGRDNPSKRLLAKLAEVLRVDSRWLQTGEGSPNTKEISLPPGNYIYTKKQLKEAKELLECFRDTAASFHAKAEQLEARIKLAELSQREADLQKPNEDENQ